MNPTYQWRATTNYRSDTTLSYGVTPSIQSSWQTANPGTLSGSWTFWFRDANVPSYGTTYTDADSSRAALSVSQTWTASINDNNYLTITVSTTLNNIVRDDIRGRNTNTPGRDITIYREQGGSAVLSVRDESLAVAHVIWSGPLTLPSYTITIAPGQNMEKSSLYLHNQSIGWPSYDDIWFGVQFRNILPADYRPGQILDNASTWQSHNRPTGADNIYTGSEWRTMRTQDGGTGQNNPPLIRNASGWRNQRKIGANRQ